MVPDACGLAKATRSIFDASSPLDELLSTRRTIFRMATVVEKIEQGCFCQSHASGHHYKRLSRIAFKNNSVATMRRAFVSTLSNKSQRLPYGTGICAILSVVGIA